MENSNLQHLKEMLPRFSPFLNKNNIRVVDLTDDFSIFEIDITDDIVNEHGIINGGILFTMADNVAAAQDIAKGRSCVTLNSTINFIRPATGNTIAAESKTIFTGRTTGVYEVSVIDEDGTVCAKASFTMFFVENRPVEKHR